MSSRSLFAIWPLFMGVALLNLGHGLQGSLVSILAAKAQFPTTVTGIIMSGFSVGLLISSILTPGIVGRVGHIRVFAAFASVVSTAVLVMPIWIDPYFWFAMRFVVGLCMAGLSIVTESWLNSSADNKSRGLILSVYMITTYMAIGLGQFLLNISDPSGFVRFIVVSALISLALVPISLAPSEQPTIERPRPVSLAKIYRASPLAFVGIFIAGLGQSAFFAMGALYGIMQGLSVGYISIMMALPPVAVIVSQFPVGMISDRIDRRLVMIALALLTAAISAVTLLTASLSPLLVIGLFAAFGGVCFPLYSLSLAHANDHISTDEMVGASSKLVLLYGLGSILGPLLAGGVMQQMGAGGFMSFMLVIHGVLAGYAIYRVLSRPTTSNDSGEFVPVSPSATTIGVATIAEEYVEREQPEESP